MPDRQVPPILASVSLCPWSPRPMIAEVDESEIGASTDANVQSVERQKHPRGMLDRLDTDQAADD